MHSSTPLAALAIMAGSAAAKIIQIDVGKGGFTFTPSSSTAEVGDTLEFHFYSSLHTAVQGDFSTPCSRGSLESTGFNSGRINNKPDGSPNVFQVPVKDTDPIWFYCSTPSHCQGGMAGVINPPTSGPNTLDAYITAAGGTSTSEGSATVQGGSVVPVGSQPSSAAGGGASSSAASVESSASSVASSASSEAASATSGGSEASTTASGAAGGSSSTAAGGSSSTSATPTTASTSGAGNVQESIFKAQGLWAGIAAGLGLVVFFMA